MMVQISEENLEYILELARTNIVVPFQLYKPEEILPLEEENAMLRRKCRDLELQYIFLIQHVEKLENKIKKLKEGSLLSKIKRKLRELWSKCK